jgi:GR25 family glycosyltransferase involved in LPS biosynthesis
MENPWSFFKTVYVISLDEAADRRESLAKEFGRFPGLNYTIVRAVDGRKNSVLRNWFETANIISTPYPFSDGALGCLASHRKVWQTILEDTGSEFPTWSLIVEDDLRFHHDFTQDHLADYLKHVPSDANVLKFGYLVDPGRRAKYTRENAYWWNFNKTGAFSTVCYAVRSDILPTFLYNKLNCPVDGICIAGMYGAASLEETFGIQDTTNAMAYKNPVTGQDQVFQGVATVADYPSTTV